MHRSLTSLAALLIGLPAYAQPPSVAGGDMSNATTKATGSSAARKLSDRAADWLNPYDFGAVGDGLTHPITATSLCPEATGTVEADWCAMQAMIDKIAAQPVLAGVLGSPGGAIVVPANTTLKLGTKSLVANRISLTVRGEDQLTSAIKIGANPSLQFGLSNGMGIGSAVISTTGAAFVAGEQLTLTGLGGICEDPPIITANSVGSSGEILTQAITHPGSCSVPPPNPLDYTTSGIGYGAQFNGTFTTGALTGALLVGGTGTNCVNGETLTGPGGTMPNGQPVVPFKLTVTNAVGGIVQKGGISIADQGAYGRPPTNPVPVTGSLSCTGASVNIAALTHSGGSLTMDHLQLIADGPGVSVATAQFNLANRSTDLHDLILVASGTNNYFSGGFDLMSMTNAVIQHIDSNNNRTYLNSNPSNAMFIVRQQNTLLGHFEHYWDYVNAAVFMGGAIDYIATASDTVPYQGLKFHRVGCGLGAHCLRMENASNTAYGNVLIDDLYASQTSQQIEITKGLNIIITNGGFGEGATRLTSPPAQADMVVLNNVNQFTLRGNSCASALTVTPSITCFHIMGTSSFGIMSGNTMTNAAKVPTFNGYVLDSGTTLNQQGGDYFGAYVTPVTDNGVNNTTILTPPKVPPCTTASSLGLTATGQTITLPNNITCLFFDNTLAITSAIIVMPASPPANAQIKFTAFSTAATALTLQVTSGSIQVIGAGMPASISASTPFGLVDVANRWQRM